MALGTITAESKPVYCWFGGSDCWTCDDLILWHKLMTDAYGKDEANTRFISSFTNDTPTVCEQLDCRSFNSNFREYFKKVGILDSLYSGIGVLAKPIGFTNDVGGSIADILSNTVGGAANTSKVLKYLLPILLVIGAIVLIWYSVKRLKLVA